MSSEQSLHSHVSAPVETVVRIIIKIPGTVWWPGLLPGREVQGLQAGHGVAETVEVNAVPGLTVVTGGVRAGPHIQVLTGAMSP